MAKCTLMMAINFSRRNGVAPWRYSYRVDGVWYVVRYGPKYHNVFKVEEPTDDELVKLKAVEVNPDGTALAPS